MNQANVYQNVNMDISGNKLKLNINNNKIMFNWFLVCNNCIFTHLIFSGYGIQSHIWTSF